MAVWVGAVKIAHLKLNLKSSFVDNDSFSGSACQHYKNTNYGNLKLDQLSRTRTICTMSCDPSIRAVLVETIVGKHI